MLLKKKYLKENVAVWCDTKDQAKVLLAELEKLDYEWSTGDKPTDHTNFVENGIRYFIKTDKDLTYCNRKDFRSDDTDAYIGFMDIIKSITKEEREILEKARSDGYAFISRDRSGLLYLSGKKPEKQSRIWICKPTTDWRDLDPGLFKMVKWEDRKPKKVSELLQYYTEPEAVIFEVGDYVESTIHGKTERGTIIKAGENLFLVNFGPKYSGHDGSFYGTFYVDTLWNCPKEDLKLISKNRSPKNGDILFCVNSEAATCNYSDGLKYSKVIETGRNSRYDMAIEILDHKDGDFIKQNDVVKSEGFVVMQGMTEDDIRPVVALNVGDLVTGNDRNSYGYTTKGELMEVIEVDSSLPYDLKVKMISGTTSGQFFPVESKYFTKVDPEKIKVAA